MHVDLKLGLSCNNACIHCIMRPVQEALRHDRVRLDATTAEVRERLDAAAARGIRHVTFTGGEVTLRQDLGELLAHAVALGFLVTVQTNGRLLSRPNRLTALLGLARASVRFVLALHGASPTVHDAVTRRLGSFDETIAAFRSLRGAGFEVLGKVVLSHVNLHDLGDTVARLVEEGASEVHIAFPHAEGFTEDEFTAVVPRYRDVTTALATVLEGGCPPIPLRFETLPYCVLPSPSLWAGNLDIEHAIQRVEGEGTRIERAMDDCEIDWSLTRPASKRHAPGCTACLLQRVCEGPWEEYAEHFGLDELLPIVDEALVEEWLLR